jgi:hypothetical protein
MGFDLLVNLNVPVDPSTGHAFVYDDKNPGGKKPFAPSKYIVPEKYRVYLVQRGSQFHSYIKPFGEMCSQASAELFLHYYPDWRRVKKDIEGEDYGWTKEDHDGFKNALKWMVSKEGVFGLSWSY